MSAPQAMTYAQAAALALSQAMQANPHVLALGEDLGRGGVFGQYRDTDGQPLVMRMPIGIWSSSAAQHSQSLEAWFAHIPGLVVVAPGTPADNHGLLLSALASGDPVVYMEHKELWGSTGEVTPGQAVPLGQTHVGREGGDVTIVSWSHQVTACLQAAEQLAAQGMPAEVIDLRPLWPWDKAAVLANVAEETRARVARLGAPRIPVGYIPTLEAQARVSAEAIAAAQRLMSK